MIFIYYFFALIQTFFAYKSLRGGIDYLNYFKQEISKPKSNYTPFATILVPCRGIDEDLQTNLEAILLQDYPQFEIVFVVDDGKDLAVSVIEEVAGNNGKDVKVIVAGKAKTSGQKVHNLRAAVLEADEKSEVFVFVDSDARPKEDWLRNLVAPLEGKNIGCATGYRWFIQKNGGFATHLRAAWNASIASALGKNTKGNFCWGGSTAIRRELFEKLDIRKKWKGTLSDDFALTNTLREAKLPIHFVPQCLTATVEDCKFGEMLEFTTRQMKITRVYSPLHFKISIISSILFTFIFWTGMILLFFVSGIHLWMTLTFVTIIFALGLGKAWLRLKAVKLVLTDYEQELGNQFIPQLLLWVISPILFLYNNLIAILSRKIIWRGIEYKLESKERTVNITKTSLQKETPRFKVSFYLEQDEEGYPPFQYEGIWVKKIKKGKYETDSIPFFVQNLSLGDIISIADGDEALYFHDVIKYSENSVIQVILLDETQAENLKSSIVKNGCEYELFDEVGLIAIHIPGTTSINSVQEFLSAGESEGKWEYKESSLRHPE